jgi:hypothetical protein
MREWMYRSTFSWPRHKLEVSGQLHAPAALPPGKSPGTHFICGWVDPGAGLDDMEKCKFFTLPGLELPPLLVVQPVASSYTDWAMPDPFISE